MPTPPFPLFLSLLSTLHIPLIPSDISAIPPSLLLLTLETMLGHRILLPLPRCAAFDDERTNKQKDRNSNEKDMLTAKEKRIRERPGGKTRPSSDDEEEIAAKYEVEVRDEDNQENSDIIIIKCLLGILADDLLSIDLSAVDPIKVVRGEKREMEVVLMALIVLARRMGTGLDMVSNLGSPSVAASTSTLTFKLTGAFEEGAGGARGVTSIIGGQNVYGYGSNPAKGIKDIMNDDVRHTNRDHYDLDPYHDHDCAHYHDRLEDEAEDDHLPEPLKPDITFSPTSSHDWSSPTSPPSQSFPSQSRKRTNDTSVPRDGDAERLLGHATQEHSWADGPNANDDAEVDLHDSEVDATSLSTHKASWLGGLHKDDEDTLVHGRDLAYVYGMKPKHDLDHHPDGLDDIYTSERQSVNRLSQKDDLSDGVGGYDDDEIHDTSHQIDHTFDHELHNPSHSGITSGSIIEDDDFYREHASWRGDDTSTGNGKTVLECMMEEFGLSVDAR